MRSSLHLCLVALLCSFSLIVCAPAPNPVIDPVPNTPDTTPPAPGNPIYNGAFDFPYNGADGTFVWVTTFPAYGQSEVFGVDQFDNKCRDTGPRNSRAIVCSSGDFASFSGELYRDAFKYMMYGTNLTVPLDATENTTTVNQGFRPVFAFDINHDPSPAWIQIAENPYKFITVGIDRETAIFVNGNRPDTFQGFVTEEAVRGQEYDEEDIPLGTAWTGCYGPNDGAGLAGTPQPSNRTCRDWTYKEGDISVAIGSRGNLGPDSRPYDQLLVTDWLSLNTASVNESLFACQAQPSEFIYCSWYPTNTDGFRNGGEDDIDCGGITVPENLRIGAANTSYEGVGATPNCNCSAGEYSLVQYGYCESCPIDTYCRNSEGCIGSCYPCFALANGTQIGTTFYQNNQTYLEGQSRCFCAEGYQLNANFNLTGDYDGSQCEPVVRGDPQITGLQGQDFQVHGIPDEFFNIITHPELQVNARFAYLEDAQCDNYTTCFTHPGTYIDQIGLMINGDRVKVLAGSMEEGLRVFVGGEEITVGTKKQLTTARIHFSSNRKVNIRTPLFSFGFVNSDKFMNQEVALLDEHLARMGSKKVVLRAGQERPHPEVPLHGLVGQTWQNIEYPENMFIEGAVADYRLGESELFGTDFPFNKYQQA